MLIGWIVFLAWLEFYSAGITLLAKRTAKHRYALYMIPFAALFYVDEFTEGFFIFTIPVKKWGKTVLIFCAIVLVAQLGCYWSSQTLTAEMAGYFEQIMLLPIGFCILVYWFGTLRSALKMIEILKTDFKGAWALAALMLPIPFLLLRRGPSRKEQIV